MIRSDLSQDLDRERSRTPLVSKQQKKGNEKAPFGDNIHKKNIYLSCMYCVSRFGSHGFEEEAVEFLNLLEVLILICFVLQTLFKMGILSKKDYTTRLSVTFRTNLPSLCLYFVVYRVYDSQGYIMVLHEWIYSVGSL